MGRWAQRQRAGGGPPQLNLIIDALDLGADVVRISYRFPIDASELLVADFSAEPTGVPMQNLTQETPTTITIEGTAPISGENAILYLGTYPGLETPQQVPLRH